MVPETENWRCWRGGSSAFSRALVEIVLFRWWYVYSLASMDHGNYCCWRVGRYRGVLECKSPTPAQRWRSLAAATFCAGDGQGKRALAGCGSGWPRRRGIDCAVMKEADGLTSDGCWWCNGLCVCIAVKVREEVKSGAKASLMSSRRALAGANN